MDIRTLTPSEAKAFYDWFGSRQDRQAFYETSALNQLVANACLKSARRIFEFGCGTGRFALELLHNNLPATAVYRGIDISTTMLNLAAARLAMFGNRATVTLASGNGGFPLSAHSVDRVVSTYVLDLLSDSEADQFFAEALRVLQPDGLLCLAGITHGTTPLSRVVMKIWQWVFRLNPRWVGGCRPGELSARLSPAQWQIRFRGVTIAWGIASEVVVASPRGSRKEVA